MEKVLLKIKVVNKVVMDNNKMGLDQVNNKEDLVQVNNKLVLDSKKEDLVTVNNKVVLDNNKVGLD